jgi:hypothetical protein
MRTWLIVLSLTALPLIGCQAPLAPTGMDAHDSVRSQTFATKIIARRGVARGVGWGRVGGWGRGFYGGFGFRPVVAAPVVAAPVVATPIVTPVVATPIVNTVVYPSFAGVGGVFW